MEGCEQKAKPLPVAGAPRGEHIATSDKQLVQAFSSTSCLGTHDNLNGKKSSHKMLPNISRAA